MWKSCFKMAWVAASSVQILVCIYRFGVQVCLYLTILSSDHKDSYRERVVSCKFDGKMELLV